MICIESTSTKGLKKASVSQTKEFESDLFRHLPGCRESGAEQLGVFNNPLIFHLLLLLQTYLYLYIFVIVFLL